MADLIPQLFASFLFASIVVAYINGSTGLIPHFHQQFFERDPTLSHFDTSVDKVPGSLLNELTLPASFGLVFVFSIFSLKLRTGHGVVPDTLTESLRCWAMKVNALTLFALALAAAILSSFAITDILKYMVGRPRPCAFYMCNYKGYAEAVDSGDFSAYNSLTTANAVGSIKYCRNSYESAWTSFPSGHAAQAFSTLGFSTLIARRMLDIPPGVYLSFLNLVASAPLVVAAWISITRIIDYKHHVDDVLVGAIIGAVCAGLAFSTAEAILEEWSTEAAAQPQTAVNEDKAMEEEEGMSMKVPLGAGMP